jgi:hypothetical protein
LVSPLCYSDGTCYLSPDQSVDVGSTVKVGFDIDLTQRGFIGILMYKLQRKNIDQSNEKDDISSEEKTTCIQLFVTWKVYKSGNFGVYSSLIEHDKDRVWNRDMLVELVDLYELYDVQHDSIEETYLMHDDTVLMTILNSNSEEECYKLEMTISEGSVKNDTQRLRYIGLNR